jgi:hypothetical protein
VEEAAAEAIEDAVQKEATTPIPIAHAAEVMRKTKSDRRKAYTHLDKDGVGSTAATRKSASSL